jgi:hypothetical protein
MTIICCNSHNYFNGFLKNANRGPLVKVKLSLCLTNEVLRHEGVWGRGCIDPRFLDLGTCWRWVVSFAPQSIFPAERALGTYWIRGWVGPRTGLDIVEKRKFLALPGPELRPLGRPAGSHSLYRLRYPGSCYITWGENIRTRSRHVNPLGYQSQQPAAHSRPSHCFCWPLARKTAPLSWTRPKRVPCSHLN